MTVTGVTDCAILAILRSSSISRNAIDKHPTSITPFRLPGPATLAGVIACASACACACISPLGLLGTPRSLLLLPPHPPGGGVSSPFERSSRGTAFEICRLWVLAAGGGSCYRCGRVRVYPCKQLTHRHQVIVVVGNDEWGGAAWKE
jgi:hypothetical protein